MPQRTIIGYVDAPGGRDALALGLALADLDPDGELIVTRIYGYNPPEEVAPPAGWRKALRDRADDELRPLRELFGTRPRTTAVPSCGLSPADGLHRLAEKQAATLLVVGVSHRHGLGSIRPGSATEQTLHGSPCAVAVAPSGYAQREPESQAFRSVVAAYDSSPESEAALDVAARLAAAARARLRIVNVVEQAVLWYGGYMGPGAARDARDYLREAVDRARRRAEETAGLEAVETQMLDGDPAKALRRAVASSDVLVVGSRDHGPLRRVLLGSVTAKLAHEPPCPLIVLPRTAHEGRAGRVASADETATTSG
jgi:nucleotide-binding universal stress UspA family protein